LCLGTNANGLVHATWRSHNVGKTLVQNVGKKIADALFLREPERYTGHVFRRTGITLFANTGASLCQIKAYSGHKSNSVPQRYIDTSVPMKTVAATATATTVVPLTSIPSSLLGKRSSTSNSNSSATSTYNINISVTGDVSGSLGLFGKE
jgi:hypothetical protein